MRPRSWTVPALCWLLAASFGPARAADATQAQDNARQAVGLFLKSCIEFYGNRDGLREWATKTGLPELRDSGADAFLYGLPGTVYDATSKGTKLVLVSEDNGSCSTFARLADGPTVLKELERILLESRVKLTVTGDKPDPKERKLQHREYTASGARREWQMLISTVNDPAGGEAILTANPW
jgi:hypothetical protein